MAFYNHVPHFSVLATGEYVKRTIGAGADGTVCIGREAVPVGVFWIKNCTSAVPQNITTGLQSLQSLQEKGLQSIRSTASLLIKRNQFM
jgi:hypothetical protein